MIQDQTRQMKRVDPFLPRCESDGHVSAGTGSDVTVTWIDFVRVLSRVDVELENRPCARLIDEPDAFVRAILAQRAHHDQSCCRRENYRSCINYCPRHIVSWRRLFKRNKLLLSYH